ncbi:NAD(P)/FAD-dependent oxidoreductase [Streptomyces sp. P38-E01]|uniref:NAD(P)/FAD-dependent oxidoreductase n=1 Tax=Streptomyces tardus TaxID=2780544 RepID=A0A949N4X5_9ACTN|nr:NAD(P)/FAD-dependent oxidoreductase [Streptomyces tardus]MBU7597412.1 NAD(P)/FAD-dependent oxidoreductase [Streptomyces tardus]
MSSADTGNNTGTAEHPAPDRAVDPDDAGDAIPDGTLDAVVIGGGAAGLNGALMLARSRRSVLVLDSGAPRNAPAEGVHGLFALDGTPPAELLRRGRAEVRRYGGLVAHGTVASAVPVGPAAEERASVAARRSAAFPEDDPLFTVTLADGRALTARRLLVATGVRDGLPEIPGLAEHWGHGVVHCPYCHGWEVRDAPIGILAVGPASAHHALLFRQLTDDLVYFTRGTELDEDTRARFAARGIRIVDAPVTEVVRAADDSGASSSDAHGSATDRKAADSDEPADGTGAGRTADSGVAGVRLAGGEFAARRVLAVASTMVARTDGLDALRLPMEELPGGMGRRVVTGLAGTTGVPGVWAAGNVADPTAQVGQSAAAGALAGAHINAHLATAETEAAFVRSATVTTG